MSTLTVDTDKLTEAASGRPANKGRSRGPQRPLWLTALLMFGVLATIAVFLVPIYWLFSSSIKQHSDI